MFAYAVTGVVIDGHFGAGSDVTPEVIAPEVTSYHTFPYVSGVFPLRHRM